MAGAPQAGPAFAGAAGKADAGPGGDHPVFDPEHAAAVPDGIYAHACPEYPGAEYRDPVPWVDLSDGQGRIAGADGLRMAAGDLPHQPRRCVWAYDPDGRLWPKPAFHLAEQYLQQAAGAAGCFLCPKQSGRPDLPDQ